MSLFTQSISGGNATTMKYFYYNQNTYAHLPRSFCLFCHQYVWRNPKTYKNNATSL